METIYLSLVHRGSWGNLLYEIPGIRFFLYNSNLFLFLSMGIMNTFWIFIVESNDIFKLNSKCFHRKTNKSIWEFYRLIAAITILLENVLPPILKTWVLSQLIYSSIHPFINSSLNLDCWKYLGCWKYDEWVETGILLKLRKHPSLN